MTVGVYNKTYVRKKAGFSGGQIPNLARVCMLESTSCRIVKHQDFTCLLRTRDRLLSMRFEQIVVVEMLVVEDPVRTFPRCERLQC